MRVLHVIEVTSGGVVTYVRTLASAQSRAGHDVHVVAPPDVTMPDVTMHHWGFARRDPLHWRSAARVLQSQVRSVDPDVVHLHSFFAGALGRLVRLRHGSRARIVYQPHSWAFEVTDSRLAAALVTRWERFAAGRTDAIVVNCDDERREGAEHGIRSAITVVGLPLDTERFRPASLDRRAELRAGWDVADRLVVVCVGRISRQKGQDQLVSEWERSPIPGAVLVLVGDGDAQRLAPLAPAEWGRSIRAVGPTDDVREWIHAADVCVLSSRYEGQSVAMAEAMSCGVPVVTTRVNGVTEALLDGPEPAGGAVVALGDMAGLLDRCRPFAEERGSSGEPSAAARARAVRQFSPPQVIARLDRVYQDAVDEPVSGPGSRRASR